MSPRILYPLSPSEEVVEFLADREGLSGGARRRFLNLLREYGSFRQVARPRTWRTLFLVSVLLALIGFVLDNRSAWSDRLVWPGCLLLAMGPIWRFHRKETGAPDSHRETDWHAYCLFLRPVILSEHPGLLDRNRNSLPQESARERVQSLPTLRDLVHERGPDFWWSAVLGLWCGMLALLVVHLTLAATRWVLSVAFPIGGLLLGPAIWTLLQRIIYRIARTDTRLSNP